MSRRKHHEIRNEIQEALSKRPMACYEISQDIDATLETVRRHVKYLRKIGVVQKSSFKIRDEEEELWTLTKNTEV